MLSQVLCVGMSDSSAGTGIQADIKTIQALGGYAATVLTSVCVQNTTNVFDMYPIPADIVSAQLKAVMDDFSPDVMKLGMLGSESVINAVGDFIENQEKDISLVVDPVMIGRIGKMLIDKSARDALKRRLLIHAEVITPNIREAEELTGLSIKDIDAMKHAAEMLMTLGCKTVVVKGGSLSADKIYNIYFDDHGAEVFERPRFDSKATHGAGTTLSSAIATGIAQGKTPKEAFLVAQDFLIEAIRSASAIGSGYGPLNHAFALKEKHG
ncbi:MAG: bifunctional hydroxymethylpyrimidine kinase/phosphomethylpyrimidine kinase [Micavibrio aeruginosavorus]|uniref:hydroxymethylpyrimidine kinase n=1 Tax=Micavibrio aeruginosavorus TaxID=349221 RepID=A0A2W5FLP4_9BACT|nr:MAG: bifunctional hydroxymethylpyrimidine kinase/phosphomethylpyrimidine kinase [Micavibrio aeruginosavorus]